MINFCKCLEKNEKSVSDGVFKPIPQMSSSSFLSAFVGIIDLFGLQSKIKSLRYSVNNLVKKHLKILEEHEFEFSEAPQKIALLGSSGLWGYQCKEQVSRFVYRLTIYIE